jgi:hypothetical protein
MKRPLRSFAAAKIVISFETQNKTAIFFHRPHHFPDSLARTIRHSPSKMYCQLTTEQGKNLL